jgi:hypothetical protein
MNNRSAMDGVFHYLRGVVKCKVENPIRVGLDTAYLIRAAKAGTQNPAHPRVVLEIDTKDPKKPIRIMDLYGRDIGVLMPCLPMVNI